MRAASYHSAQRHKLTREWGDRWAGLLWEEFLGRQQVDWEGAHVLDFGCAWGYMPKYLVEHAGVAEAHGIDLHPMWEAMTDGFRPDAVPGVHLHAGELTEQAALAPLRFDVIVSLGTLFLLKPTELMDVLHWFHDHLKPGGLCLFQTRVYPHYNGADLGERAPAFAHLLFGEQEIAEFLRTSGAGPARYVNPSTAATYLVQFARAGFAIEHVERLYDGLDEQLFSEHAAKLRWIDPDELRTSGLAVRLARPSLPDLSIVDRGNG